MTRRPHSLLACLLFCLCSQSEVRAKATISEQTVGEHPSVVLENELVRAVFVPADGGQCTDFVYKPTGKRLVTPMGGTLVGNRVWNYTDRDLYLQWQRAAWDHEIERRPGEVALAMRSKGKVGFTRSTVFAKRIVLRDGEALLHATYTFSVGQRLMASQKIGLWFQNSRVGVPGERNVYTFPLTEGLARLDSGDALEKTWFYNPARGWLALRGETGTGLCLEMEYRHLMGFLLYPGRQPQPELMWAFRTMDIDHGASFTTAGRLVPFHGIGAVHGAGGGVVAGFDAPDQTAAGKEIAITAQLTAGMPIGGLLRTTLRPGPDGADVPVYEAKVELTPGEVQTVRFTVTPPGEGLWLLKGSLLSDGREIMDFARPLAVGVAAASVKIPPKEERLGLKTERFEDRVALVGDTPPDIEYSTEIETPHVKWAKPYAGGKLKVLVLVSCIAGREAAELAQRLDMDLLWVTAGPRGALIRMGYVASTPTRARVDYRVEHMNEHIKRQLAQPCDAVIIGGLDASLFTEEVAELISRRVSEGMGLVYVDPKRGSKAFYSLLGIKKARRARGVAGWSSEGDHFITAGIPFDVLPQTAFSRYELEGEVLAKVADAPLLVAQEGPGKGRTVVLSYRSGWGSRTYANSVTPWVEGTDCKFAYWEYHFSLLAKALVWAARKEPDLQLKEVAASVSADESALKVRLDNAGDAMSTQVEMTLSDAYGGVKARDTRNIQLPPAGQTVSVPLPEDLPGGLHLADVILKDASGRVMAWGSASFSNKSTVEVTRIAFDKRAYHPGDTARAVVELEGTDDGPAEAAVKAEFTDALGRLLGRAEKRVPVAAGAAFEFPVGTPVVTTARLRVEVTAEGGRGSVAESEVLTFPEKFARRRSADWTQRIRGTVAGSYQRWYLAQAFAERLKNFRVDAVMASAKVTWWNEREYEWPVRLGFQILPMGASFGYINIGHRVPRGKMTFTQQRAEYRKTHAKEFLVRPVCLNDSPDLDALAEKLHGLADYAGWLEPIDYNLGDEMSTTYYVQPMDYDFSTTALAAFRVWLKKQYGKLEALNEEWATEFASWDNVMPMTALEVKGRSSCAPWADHREFMDTSFAEFFDWTRERLRERDPEAQVSMSGSQAAEAYGGYDWSRVARVVRAAHNYTHQNTSVMQRSFNPGLSRLACYGYGRVNPVLRNELWWNLFEGNYGGLFYHLQGLLRPDLTYGPTAADALPIIHEFTAGTAKLLKNCERVADIGIHYSHASIRAAYICGEAARFRSNRAGWIQAFEDAGYQCEFLATAQIEAGELATRRYVAFVLPFSLAVSEKEAAALRDYVKKGGLLLADGKTGMMNLRCRTLAKGVLDDLFGIVRSEVNPLASSREGQMRYCPADSLKFAGEDLEVKVAEPDLAVGDGSALCGHGTTPMVARRKTGKGTAVYLNMFMDSFIQRRARGLEAPMHSMLDNLLKLHGLRPAVVVTIGEKTRRKAYTVRYRAGDALYVGAVSPFGGAGGSTIAKDKRDPSVLMNAKAIFPKEGYVYDLRSGAALGRVREVEKKLPIGDAVLYAVLPYAVSGVAVTAAVSDLAPGQPVRYRVSVGARGGSPGMHVVGVEVIDPQGRKQEHYGTRLLARNGRTEGEFLTALNDPSGRWAIRVTDYVTRTAGECVVCLGADPVP